MTSRGRKDITASVRQRLLNKAKSERRAFNEFLQYYAMERFLFRLSKSPHADKFEAMLKLRELNSRMKDCYDIWLLARQFNFEGAVLAEALRRTLEKRGTALPEEETVFDAKFIDAKQVQWTAFRKRLNDYGNIPGGFAEVLAAIGEFLAPVARSLHSGTKPPHYWSAPGP